MFVQVFRQREEGLSICLNIKKMRGVYNDLGLQLRNKRQRQRLKAKLRDNRY